MVHKYSVPMICRNERGRQMERSGGRRDEEKHTVDNLVMITVLFEKQTVES